MNNPDAPRHITGGTMSDTPRHMRDADQQFAAEAPVRASTTDGTPNPNYEPMLQFFVFDHLRISAMRDTSEMFAGIAHAIVSTIPRNPERTVSLRKLLEAKDCAVRAVIMK